MEFGQFVIFYFSIGIALFFISCTSWIVRLFEIENQTEKELYLVLSFVLTILTWPFVILCVILENSHEIINWFLKTFFPWVPKLFNWIMLKLTKIFIG